MNEVGHNETPQDEIVVRGKKIAVLSKEVPLTKLRFYLENPRLYSLVRMNGADPTEEEIEEKLLQMDHVKNLISSIKMNGGLIEPVIVRQEGMVVLEGNSRLAAYKYLAKMDPAKWGKMRARILPKGVSDSDVFALLGEYHIHGKTNWVPFEQANYLYRRQKDQGLTIEDLAKEINLSKPTVTHLIEVFKFMLKHHQQDTSRWSYYDEYLKNRKITAARVEYPEMDKLVVKKIATGEISTAVDLRDGLKVIAAVGGKTLSKFAEGKMNFSDARETAEHKGAADVTLQRLTKFRKWFVEQDVMDDILNQSTRRDELLFELDHIQKQAAKISRKLKEK